MTKDVILEITCKRLDSIQKNINDSVFRCPIKKLREALNTDHNTIQIEVLAIEYVK